MRYDLLTTLHLSENQAILFFVRKDLLGESVESIENLWRLPEVEKIIKKQ